MKKPKSKAVPDWLRNAREKWEYKGQTRPPFAIEPKAGQRSVWDFPRPPALVSESRKIEVISDNQTLAMTHRSLAVQETASPPTFYVPQEDVNLDLLLQIKGKTSLCEWKGSAMYWALKSNSSQPVAWSYAQPFAPYEALKDHFAFYPQYLECYVNGEWVRPQPGQFYAGWITDDLVGPFKGEPGTGHW